ncbi:MAG: hypothetical protein SNJ63_08095 [Sphingomonadaceae bacterium]
MNEKAAAAVTASPLRKVHSVDHEVLTALVETKAINFDALGQVVSRVGPASIFADDGWIRWCGSDLRIWRWPGPGPSLDIPFLRGPGRG